MDAASLPTDELIDEVMTWAARVARGDANLLVLIGEVDAREAWGGHGVTSCAHWLSWKIGWSICLVCKAPAWRSITRLPTTGVK